MFLKWDDNSGLQAQSLGMAAILQSKKRDVAVPRLYVEVLLDPTIRPAIYSTVLRRRLEKLCRAQSHRLIRPVFFRGRRVGMGYSTSDYQASCPKGSLHRDGLFSAGLDRNFGEPVVTVRYSPTNNAEELALQGQGDASGDAVADFDLVDGADRSDF